MLASLLPRIAEILALLVPSTDDAHHLLLIYQGKGKV